MGSARYLFSKAERAMKFYFLILLFCIIAATSGKSFFSGGPFKRTHFALDHTYRPKIVFYQKHEGPKQAELDKLFIKIMTRFPSLNLKNTLKLNKSGLDDLLRAFI